MDAGSGTDGHERLVFYSDEATLDLADIHTHTNVLWGWEQAEDYIQFLFAEAQKVAEGERRGRPVAQRPGRFLVVARWPGTRAGHRIVYEPIPQGIYVVRILHTAMDLLRHFNLPGQHRDS